LISLFLRPRADPVAAGGSPPRPCTSLRVGRPVRSLPTRPDRSRNPAPDQFIFPGRANLLRFSKPAFGFR